MRVNLPVTGTERKLSPGKPIVTKTDLKGLVTYCNQSFLDISGFTRDEIIGAPQNIVRHPEIPPVVFEDLWRVLHAGLPWRGTVKNRCKNGDYYWVDAYVTPITEDGKAIGYMSVRTVPEKSAVERAEALYEAINAKKERFKPTPIKSTKTRTKIVLLALAVLGASLSTLAGMFTGWQGITFGAIAAVIALSTAFYAITRLINPLDHIAKAIERIDEGKIDYAIPSRRGATEEVSSKLEGLRIHLRAMFADVLLSAHEVAEQSDYLDSLMCAIQTAAEVQSETVMKISAAMEEMSVAIAEISRSTDQALLTARQTQVVADNGIETISTIVATNKDTVGVVSASANQISEVNASISRISGISQIIREIADQTNLLALNAAIEAARAGEQGRGFAVVADEVRKLAERTSTSTVEITTAVQSVVSEASQAVATMDKAKDQVVEGTRRIEESNEGLHQIRVASEDAVAANQDITDMLKQQSAASHEIAANMDQVSISAETAKQSVDSASGATSQLRNSAKELRRLLKHMEAAIHC